MRKSVYVAMAIIIATPVLAYPSAPKITVGFSPTTDRERRNSSLVRLLRQHKVAIPVELVVNNTGEK